MKQKLMVVGILCLLAVSANAQRIGAKVGISLSNAAVESMNIDEITADNIIGMQAGLVGEVKLLPAVFINTGILYSQKGYGNDVYDQSFDPGHVQVNYLEVPLNAALKFSLGLAKLFVQAGPYIDYGLNAKQVFNDSSIDPIAVEFEDDTYHLKRIDYGASVGAGVEISILQIGINYSFGLEDISTASDIEIKNGVFGVSAAMLF